MEGLGSGGDNGGGSGRVGLADSGEDGGRW